MRASRKRAIALASAVVLIGGVLTLWPFLPTIAFLWEVTGHSGAVRRWMPIASYEVSTRDFEVPTRHGTIAARAYVTTPASTATLLVIPGVHQGGLDEPRQTYFATRLAATGLTVVVVPLPDLREFRLTGRSTTQIEDAAQWLLSNRTLTPRGRMGLAGISFGGGLAVVAAGRPSIADRLDLVLSLGGHGDFGRTLRYYSTGRLPDGTLRLPHDYSVALTVIAALPSLVPPDQTAPLERGVRTYLDAAFDSSATQIEAGRLIARARDEASRLPEPARAILTAVVDRDVVALGQRLAPAIDSLAADPALSPERSPPPLAPVFLLHGRDDNVIPSSETVELAAHLARHRIAVRALLTPVLSHVGIQRDVGVADYGRLIGFWRAWRGRLGDD